MKVYLDNSALNRPFDDQSFPIIRLETLAVIFILEFIESGDIKMVNSSVIEYENSKNPFLERKNWVLSCLLKAKVYQKLNEKIKTRAQGIEKFGIAAIDSLHLATAEVSTADYFITCDNEIIKRYKGFLRVNNPVDFIEIIKNKL